MNYSATTLFPYYLDSVIRNCLLFYHHVRTFKDNGLVDADIHLGIFSGGIFVYTPVPATVKQQVYVFIHFLAKSTWNVWSIDEC
jgi:hypothetical protein